MIRNQSLFSSILLLMIFGMFSCKTSNNETPIPEKAPDEWKYFGLESPGKAPVVFSPDIISTHRNERDFAMSPNGKIIFYSMVLPANNFNAIVYLNFDGFFWSEPEVAWFSGSDFDLEPAFSPDGKKLLFVSKRPVEQGSEKKDYDIWYLNISESGWSDPKNFGNPVNSSGDEYYPSVAANGNLYFTAAYENSFGREDIYVSRFEDGNYLEPENLGEAINTDMYEFNAFISPDESYILFSSWGREDDIGGGDLYIAFHNEDGSWTKARNMGSTINSDQLDYCPFITQDEEFLFFTSQRTNAAFNSGTRKRMENLQQMSNSIENGLGNIYWVEFDKDAWR